jgi:hypothetical protein
LLGDDGHDVGWASVIRNVVVGRLRVTDDPDQRAADVAMLHEGLAGIAALQPIFRSFYLVFLFCSFLSSDFEGLR